MFWEKNSRLTYQHSFNAGTIRCKEMFGEHGDADGIPRTIEWAMNLFSELQSLEKTSFTGIGGTITTVAAMDQEMEIYAPQKIQGHKLSLSSIEDTLRILIPMPVEQRKALPGLQPQRADIIPYGMAVLVAAMRVMKLSEISVSDADNLEGYAIKYKNAISP